jgi:hypothetical protein
MWPALRFTRERRLVSCLIRGVTTFGAPIGVSVSSSLDETGSCFDDDRTILDAKLRSIIFYTACDESLRLNL